MQRAQSIEERSEEEDRLLVPVLEATETEDIERLVETAAIIAREREGTLVVLYPTTVARSTPSPRTTSPRSKHARNSQSYWGSPGRRARRPTV
jgi:hypothetical protein